KRSGAAVLVPGNGVGFDLGNESYTWQEKAGGASEDHEMYGWSVASGNWNVDQYDDLAVGNPYEDIGPSGNIAYRAGAVYVHYGGATLLGGTGLILREGSGLVPGTPQAHEWFGLSLATARLGTNNFEFL